METSTTSEPSTSIFDGTDDLIAATFKLQPNETLKQKSISRRITRVKLDDDKFVKLISDIYRQIETNWHGREPSRENWRLERQTFLSPENSSPEVLLERAIAILGEEGCLPEWFNQIPVASGLIDDRLDKRAAVDLLHYESDRAELVELKWESDTPAFAAFEILRYGLAYLFCYMNRELFGYSDKALMNCSQIPLRVLAPHRYYADGDCTPFERGIDTGLRRLAAEVTDGALSMDFRFLEFPRDFDLPFSLGEEVLQLRQRPSASDAFQPLMAAMEGLRSPWPSQE